MIYKKRLEHKAPVEIVKRPLREFYVNGRLEFSLFYDSLVTDKDQILKEFLKDKDWKFMSQYCDWTYTSCRFSEDLSKVFIKVKVIGSSKK